jgi:hypothetical protein
MESIFNQQIGIFKNVASQEFCNQIIEGFEKNIDKTYNRQDPTLKSKRLYSSSADKKDLSIDINEIDRELGHKFVDNCINPTWKLYRNKYEILNDHGFKNFGIHSLKVQKTNPGGGYHTFHCEQGASFTAQRFGVYTFYLNDVEEGGETEFLYQNFRVSPERGMMCYFPASWSHTHRGNPPLSNVKYIVTGWMIFNEK